MAKVDQVEQARLKALERTRAELQSRRERDRARGTGRWLGVPDEYRKGWTFARVRTRPLPGQPPDARGEIREHRWAAIGWIDAPASVRCTADGPDADRAVYKMIPTQALDEIRQEKRARDVAKIKGLMTGFADRVATGMSEHTERGISVVDDTHSFGDRLVSEIA